MSRYRVREIMATDGYIFDKLNEIEELIASVADEATAADAYAAIEEVRKATNDLTDRLLEDA